MGELGGQSQWLSTQASEWRWPLAIMHHKVWMGMLSMHMVQAGYNGGSARLLIAWVWIALVMLLRLGCLGMGWHHCLEAQHATVQESGLPTRLGIWLAIWRTAERLHKYLLSYCVESTWCCSCCSVPSCCVVCLDMSSMCFAGDGEMSRLPKRGGVSAAFRTGICIELQLLPKTNGALCLS